MKRTAGAQGKAVLSRREPVYRRDVRNQRDGMQVDKTGLFISLVVPLGARQGGGQAGRGRRGSSSERQGRSGWREGGWGLSAGKAVPLGADLKHDGRVATPGQAHGLEHGWHGVA